MNRRLFAKRALVISATLPLSKVSFSNYRCFSASQEDNTCVVNIDDYGCHSHSHHSYFDNRAILQYIIDTCAQLSLKNNSRMVIHIPEGTYYLSATASNSKSNSTIGAYCLLMRSNIILKGEGVLKLLPNQYGKGAYFRILASEKNDKIENSDIRDITFDGNSSFQTDGFQASNILLECKANITIANVRSINANGNGILIKGEALQNQPVADVCINDCFVTNCKKIGIQVSQFNGLKIYNNIVSHCNDNGIDIYGDLGGTFPNITNGNHFSIFNNKVSFCLNGIFPETVSNGKVYGNKIEYMKESGVHINRIHGLPSNIIIENNQIVNSTSGVFFTGDMKNILVNNNKIYEVTNSFFSFGGGKGNTSGIQVINNLIFVGDNKSTLSSFAGEKIRNINVSYNYITQKHSDFKFSLNRNNARFVDEKTVIIK